MSSLNSVLFSPSSSNSRAWSLSSSGSFSVKSFFCALSKVSNPLMFLPAKFLWSSKVPSKVKALAWLVAHGKVNTNDKLQLRRPYKALCTQWCILCKGNGESIGPPFSSLSRYYWTLAQVVQSSRFDLGPSKEP
ncbi:hypothetical protein CK203_111345 [Vitis vinifera]|uniref:Reverse transcriptase zinc-binding domain-containing protein n=1 Tax=Vitis vinifera TaxID=29760 RepID=A0A438CRR6_VITVI|nr:hypothetical protein CK203_111345 [Vitis vinifera]